SSSVRIVGNLIADNNEPQTPVHAGGAFGVGVGLGGTVDAEIRANTITGNSAVGVWITSSEDFPPTGTRVTGNAWADNALDIALAADEAAAGEDNCFDLPPSASTSPVELSGCRDAAGTFSPQPAPKGVPFS